MADRINHLNGSVKTSEGGRTDSSFDGTAAP